MIKSKTDATKIKIVCPYPYGGSIGADTINTINKLIESDIDCYFVKLQSSNIVHVRNELICAKHTIRKKQKIGEGYTHLLFIDSDVSIDKPANVVRRFLSFDKPIVSALYPRRGNPGRGVAATLINNREELLSMQTTGLREVRWVGFGFVLIKRCVLQGMEYPWVRMPIIETRYVAEQIGEDIGFCMNARRAGNKVFCDCDSKANHNL